MIELIDHPRHRVLLGQNISFLASAAVREGISSRCHEVPDFTIVRRISSFRKFADVLVGCALIGWLMTLILAVIFEISDGGLDRAAKYGRKEVRGSVFKDFKMGAGEVSPGCDLVE